MNKILDDRSEKKIIGFLSGHQEMEISGNLRFFASILNEQYQVQSVSTEEGTPINLESIDILMIISPKSRIGWVRFA